MASRILARHADDAEVAFGAQGRRLAQDLKRDASIVGAALPPKSETGVSEVLLVFKTDRYAFAATVLGAWSRGYTITLPPNQRKETIAALLQDRQLAALAHDTQVGGHLQVPELLRADSGATVLSELRAPSGTAAIALTSGSTGAPTPWPKSLHQLLSETETLAEAFGLKGARRFVPTIPPGHLYGLLFGVLLPLTAGGSFLRETPLTLEPLAQAVEQQCAEVLVTVPVHLRGAKTLPAGALSSLKTVFSSTAPLPDSTASEFESAHGLNITEVFGSTETGGIASRLRPAESRWKPLPGVSLNTDETGALTVQSPFLADPSQPFVTSDRVELAADGTFVHTGRRDGIVKVGGRRVSLPALEQWLLSQPGVEDCAVIARPDPVRGALILASVVAPSWNVDEEQSLRTRMTDHFDASTVPRRIVFLPRVPREENGKLSHSQLLRLFGLSDSGAHPQTELVFEAVSQSEGTLRTETTIPENYFGFVGHFDQYAVLPGAVQLEQLLARAVQQVRPDLVGIRALAKVKFLGRIAPGDRVSIEAVFKNDTATCAFKLSKASQVCSSGTATFFTRTHNS